MVRHRKDTLPAPPDVTSKRTEDEPTPNFWDHIISEHLPPQPSPEERHKEQKELEDKVWRQIEKQAVISLSVQEVKRLTRVVEKQRQEIKRLQGPDAHQASVLSMIVHAVKRERIGKGGKLSQELIANDVDKWIEKRKLQLGQVCPERWVTLKGLPRLFVDCLRHSDPKVRQLAKTLISRA